MIEKRKKAQLPAGFEPTNSLSRGMCSTAVLQPLPNKTADEWPVVLHNLSWPACKVARAKRKIVLWAKNDTASQYFKTIYFNLVNSSNLQMSAHYRSFGGSLGNFYFLILSDTFEYCQFWKPIHFKTDTFVPRVCTQFVPRVKYLGVILAFLSELFYGTWRLPTDPKRLQLWFCPSILLVLKLIV